MNIQNKANLNVEKININSNSKELKTKIKPSSERINDIAGPRVQENSLGMRDISTSSDVAATANNPTNDIESRRSERERCLQYSLGEIVGKVDAGFFVNLNLWRGFSEEERTRIRETLEQIPPYEDSDEAQKLFEGNPSEWHKFIDKGLERAGGNSEHQRLFIGELNSISGRYGKRLPDKGLSTTIYFDLKSRADSKEVKMDRIALSPFFMSAKKEVRASQENNLPLTNLQERFLEELAPSATTA